MQKKHSNSNHAPCFTVQTQQDTIEERGDTNEWCENCETNWCKNEM